MKETDIYEKEWIPALLKMRQENDSRFDRQLSYISSGAIALSVTLVSTTNAVATPAIVVSWSLLIMCLFTNLVSLKTAVKSADEEIANRNNTECFVNKNARITKALNIVSLAFLAAGLILMLAALAA